jgi:glycerophosphoryl diester phosphodiesterase
MPASQRAAAVIAHRGASAYHPEHTVDAYDCALAMGADRLELDVRATADEALVVLHDPTLARTAGVPRAIAQAGRADLLALEPARRPLTLDEVLGRYGRRTSYLVELKDPTPRDAFLLLEVLARHDVAGRVAVQSFDRAALLQLSALGPGCPWRSCTARPGARRRSCGTCPPWRAGPGASRPPRCPWTPRSSPPPTTAAWPCTPTRSTPIPRCAGCWRSASTG